VWKGENYDNDAVYFDGTHSNGEPLPDGTYYFVLTHNNAIRVKSAVTVLNNI
jgi:hypothetical protein